MNKENIVKVDEGIELHSNLLDASTFESAEFKSNGNMMSQKDVALINKD